MKPYVVIVHARHPKAGWSHTFKAADRSEAVAAVRDWLERSAEQLGAASSVSLHRLRLGAYDHRSGVFTTQLGKCLLNIGIGLPIMPQLYRSERDRVVDDGRPPFAPSEASAG